MDSHCHPIPGRCERSPRSLALSLSCSWWTYARESSGHLAILPSIRLAGHQRWSMATSSFGNRLRSCSISRADLPIPSGPTMRARADIMRWQSWQLQHFGPDACVPLTFQRLVKKRLNQGPPDQAIVDKALEAFRRDASVLDAHLAKQHYLVGQELTLADLSVAAVLVYAKEAEMPLAQYPRVQEWCGRIYALKSWRESAPTPAPAAA